MWIFWVIAGVVVVMLASLCWRLWNSVDHDERKLFVSWWAARNGWRFSRGTDALLGYLRGDPFERGVSRDVQNVLRGLIAGRPALVVQFSWYANPDSEQREDTGMSGMKTGGAVAALVELPGLVPAVTIRPQVVTDVLRGQDTRLESERFNTAYRVDGRDERFNHAVVTPRLMALMLDSPARYGVRVDGRTLTVWFDASPTRGAEYGLLVRQAAAVYEVLEPYLFSTDWSAAEEQRPISQIPDQALGEPPTGAIYQLEQRTHRGHDLELYESRPKLWGREQIWVVAVKLAVPTGLWPKVELVPKATGPADVTHLTIHDRRETGFEEFDRQFLVGSKDRDFVSLLLDRDLTDWLLADPRAQSLRIVWEDEGLTPEEDGVPATVVRAVLSVVAECRLADTEKVNEAVDFACDVYARLPEKVRMFDYRTKS